MIIPLVEVNWTNVWMETGIGFGIVFVVLTLIIFILSLFNVFANGKNNKAVSAPTVQTPAATATAAPVASASDEDKAAVATALYLFYQNVHDVESGVITIRHNENSTWHQVLNPRL